MNTEELNNSAIFYHFGHTSGQLYKPADDIMFGNAGPVERDGQGRIKCNLCEAPMNSEAGQRMCPKARYIHIDVHRSEVQKLVATFGNTTGGAKIRKKVNQVYGRQLRDMALQEKKELDKEVARRLAHFNENLVRKKPKWLPTIAWRILQNIVLKSDTMV